VWIISVNRFGTASLACLYLATTVPALANGSVILPDPSGITLFSLGLAGLILGRRAAARRKDDD
jgi:hypothetical protein